MDIKQVREKKRIAEEQIHELISKFSEDTGLSVTDVRASVVTLATEGGKYVGHSCVGVTVDVEV